MALAANLITERPRTHLDSASRLRTIDSQVGVMGCRPQVIEFLEDD